MEFLRIKTEIYAARAKVDKNNKIVESKKLKKLFDYYGSDKSTNHNYHLIYASLFQKVN